MVSWRVFLMLTRESFLRLRTKAYKMAGEIGTIGETEGELSSGYHHMCKALDEIDALGYRLGILDSETNEVLPKKRVRK